MLGYEGASFGDALMLHISSWEPAWLENALNDFSDLPIKQPDEIDDWEERMIRQGRL